MSLTISFIEGRCINCQKHKLIIETSKLCISCSNKIILKRIKNSQEQNNCD